MSRAQNSFSQELPKRYNAKGAPNDRREEARSRDDEILLRNVEEFQKGSLETATDLGKPDCKQNYHGPIWYFSSTIQHTQNNPTVEYSATLDSLGPHSANKNPRD